MRFFILLGLFLFPYNSALNAQSMSNAQLEEIISTVGDSLSGDYGQWRFKVGDMWMICLTDAEYNRMRIITPIIAVNDMNEDEMEKCMKANFHTALDVKYCISDGILWSAFIHPLKELSDDQIVDAIKQVYSASSTFGTIYTSTRLVFPGKKAASTVRESKS